MSTPWDHLDSLTSSNPNEDAPTSSFAQPSDSLWLHLDSLPSAGLVMSGDWTADRTLAVKAMEQGASYETIADAWQEAHGNRPADRTLRGWRERASNSQPLSYNPVGGRPRKFTPKAYLKLSADVEQCIPQRIKPDEKKFKELVDDALVLSYLERGQIPPVSHAISKSTMWRLKNNYWHDNEKLVLKRIVDRQTFTRYLNEHDVRNAITLAVLLHRYDRPFPDLDWEMAREGHINMDSSSIQFGYASLNKKELHITPKMEQTFRQNGWNLKFIDTESEASAFGMRLLSAITASGHTLPLVCIFAVKRLDTNDVRIWPIEDLSTSQSVAGVGYVVGVQGFHTEAMRLVYNWYFDAIVLPYCTNMAAKLKGKRYPDQDDPRHNIPERFLVTLDGEMVQLASVLDPVTLDQFAKHNIGVVKLMAGCSASYQPSDVVLCYHLVKQWIKSGKYSNFVQPGVQRSLQAMMTSLKKDPTASKWRRAFMSQVSRGVLALAACVHNAFTPPIIAAGFSTIGIKPLNEEKILRRTKGLRAHTLAHALKQIPLLREQAKGHFTVTEEQMSAAGISSLGQDALEKSLSETEQASKDAKFMERPCHRGRAMDLSHVAHAQHIQQRCERKQQELKEAEERKQERQRNTESKQRAKKAAAQRREHKKKEKEVDAVLDEMMFDIGLEEPKQKKKKRKRKRKRESSESEG